MHRQRVLFGRRPMAIRSPTKTWRRLKAICFALSLIHIWRCRRI